MSGTTRTRTAKAATKSQSKLSGKNTKAKSLAPKEKNKGGRPPKLQPTDETIKTIEGLAKIQCTNAEAAAVLSVSRETFEKFLGDHLKASEAWNNGKDGGKASLRRIQFGLAQKGNTAMAIWLGKQYLGQKDKQEIDQNVNVRIEDMGIDELRDYLAREAEALGIGRSPSANARGKSLAH
jgi:hypothetical protein